MPLSRYTQLLTVIALLTLSSGCGEPSDRAHTTKVSGKVSFEGKAIEMGTITLFPVAGGKHATGALGQNGEFVLSTYEPEDGAIPGKHKVVINVSYENPDGTKVPDTIPRVPEKYASSETTPLTVEIVDNGEPLLIELEKQSH